MTEERTAGKKKLALGKGIASLLETSGYDATVEGFRETSAPESSTPRAVSDGVLTVGIEGIVANPYQPRKVFKAGELRELADSIAENGLIQPIVVSRGEEGKFEIISGERRFRASQMAGLKQVPVLVKRATDREKLVMAIIENVQRSDLNCIEEALAYHQLMDEFRLGQEELAKKIGKERSTVANFLRILKLPRPVIQLLQKEQLSFGHAKVLAVIKDGEKCTRIAKQIFLEGLSVRQAEKLVRKDGMGESRPGTRGEDRPRGEDLTSLKEALEKKTGHHFTLKARSNGSGQIIIHYNDREEFNTIFDELMK